MKKFLSGVIAGILLAIVSVSASAQVSVSIGGRVAPGVYGAINLGDDRPAVVYDQPQVIYEQGYVGDPAYYYVPDYQQRDWRRYCGQYRACGRPVYFVRDDWVRERYYRDHPRFDDRRRDDDRRWDHRDDHRDDHRRDDHGHGDHGDHGDRHDR